MEADLLSSLPSDLVVQAQALPVDALHVGRGVVGGDQTCGVPGASYSQLKQVSRFHSMSGHFT